MEETIQRDFDFNDGIDAQIIAFHRLDEGKSAARERYIFDYRFHLEKKGPDRRYNPASVTLSSQDIPVLMETLRTARSTMAVLQGRPISFHYSKTIESNLQWPQIKVSVEDGTVGAAFRLSSNSHIFWKTLSLSQIDECVTKLGLVDEKAEQALDALKDLALRKKKFQGKTITEALALAQSEIPSENIFECKKERDEQPLVSQGKGDSADAAILDGRSHIPPIAYDVGKPEIVQHGNEYEWLIEAPNENEAREQIKEKVPRDAKFSFECERKPEKGGFLELWRVKRWGRWKVAWAEPFVVEITYKLPAEFIVRYY